MTICRTGIAAAGQSAGVIVGGEIADQSGNGNALTVQTRENCLEQSRLPRSGAGNETDYEHTGRSELIPKSAGHNVVMLQHSLPDLDEAGRLAHDSNSSATSSNSRPETIFSAPLPHTEQRTSHADTAGCSAQHAGQ